MSTPKRRRKVELTEQQKQAIARVRAAAKAYEKAERARKDALNRRTEVVRAEFATLDEIGWARAARELDDLIGEGTLRGYTQDLRATKRAED